VPYSCNFRDAGGKSDQCSESQAVHNSYFHEAWLDFARYER